MEKEMKGHIKVYYSVLCEDDKGKDISIKQLVENEKVANAIKREFGEGARNLEVSANGKDGIRLSTAKAVHDFIIDKDDFIDALDLAEENARSRMLNRKKGCDRIALVNLETID
ncbi:MAG: hypothetical protein B5M52_03315 [Helicobacteraceae bacterium 4484_230]|nr:MAG: hypothetical protein B5M52_03315 [Helicobacteraceae bacterium 4484_230]